MKTGIYFRFGTENIDWLDLTEEQREEVTSDWKIENWKRLADFLTEILSEIVEEKENEIN